MSATLEPFLVDPAESDVRVANISERDREIISNSCFGSCCNLRCWQTAFPIIATFFMITSVFVNLIALTREDKAEVCDYDMIRWLYWNVACHFLACACYYNSDLENNITLQFTRNIMLIVIYVILPISGINLLTKNWFTCRVKMPLSYWTIGGQIFINWSMLFGLIIMVKYTWNRTLRFVPPGEVVSVNQRSYPNIEEVIARLTTYKYSSVAVQSNHINSSENVASSSNSASSANSASSSNSVNIDINLEDAHCCICIDRYQDGDLLRMLKCKHHMHKTCADKWFTQRPICPLCTQSILEE